MLGGMEILWASADSPNWLSHYGTGMYSIVGMSRRPHFQSVSSRVQCPGDPPGRDNVLHGSRHVVGGMHLRRTALERAALPSQGRNRVDLHDLQVARTTQQGDVARLQHHAFGEDHDSPCSSSSTAPTEVPVHHGCRTGPPFSPACLRSGQANLGRRGIEASVLQVFSPTFYGRVGETDNYAASHLYQNILTSSDRSLPQLRARSTCVYV